MGMDCYIFKSEVFYCVVGDEDKRNEVFVAIADFTHIAEVGLGVAFYATELVNGAIVLFTLTFNDISEVAKGSEYCKIKAVRDTIKTVEVREDIFALEGDGMRGEERCYFRFVCRHFYYLPVRIKL